MQKFPTAADLVGTNRTSDDLSIQPVVQSAKVSFENIGEKVNSCLVHDNVLNDLFYF